MGEPIRLDPHWASVLADADSTSEPTVAELRRDLRDLGALLPRVGIGPVNDVTIVVDDRRTRCRVYEPALSGRSPVLAVYLHGGGWVAGDLETHDALCRQIVHHSNATLVAVDYPLAPEYPYPAALGAASDVYQWLGEHLADLGLERGTSIALVGESAGANLAIALTLTLTSAGDGVRPPAGLIVTHPVLHPGTDTASHRHYGAGLGLTTARLERLWHHYAPSIQQRCQPTVSPLLASSFAGFPVTWVQTAQYDPTRSDGERFAERLRADGVATHLTCYRGQIHGFQTAFDRVPAAAESLRDIAVALTSLAGA